jgi:hypothetical protein
VAGKQFSGVYVDRLIPHQQTGMGVTRSMFANGKKPMKRAPREYLKKLSTKTQSWHYEKTHLAEISR